MSGNDVHGRVADAVGGVFYAVVAVIALAGQTLAAGEWLGWPLVYALPAVAALELGGIALTAHADVRRRLGERAAAARLLSAAVAVFAVVVNWVGHADRLQGVFFAGMSALGYGVWLINAGARRRDQMRADGNLPAVGPAYGLWRWLRHPAETRAAHALAQADPALGLYGSLAAAASARRAGRRQAAIAEALRRKLATAVDPLTARIAVATFDLDEIAARLAAGADYDGLTALIAADLAPGRLARTAEDSRLPAATEETRPAGVATAQVVAPSRTKRQPSAAGPVAVAVAEKPDATNAQIAARLGLSEATVQRHRRQPVDSVSTTSPAGVAVADVADTAPGADTSQPAVRGSRRQPVDSVSTASVPG